MKDGHTFLPAQAATTVGLLPLFRYTPHHRSCYLHNLLILYPCCPLAKLNIHSAGTWTLQVFSLIAPVSSKGQMERNSPVQSHTPIFSFLPSLYLQFCTRQNGLTQTRTQLINWKLQFRYVMNRSTRW